jgi:hypothetical protein
MSEKLMFDAPGCQGVTSEYSGRTYKADRQGFIHVDDPKDAAFLKKGGYLATGGMPKLGKYWECECGWQSAINSCPRCQRNDLTRVEL